MSVEGFRVSACRHINLHAYSLNFCTGGNRYEPGGPAFRGLVPGGAWPARPGVGPQGLFQPVLQRDDPARGVHRRARVDQLAGARGKVQLVAGVPAVASSERSGVTSPASPITRRKAGVAPSISAALPIV